MVEPFSWASTVDTVAPVRSVAEPELPTTIGAPALDGRVILRRESSEHSTDGAGIRGVFQLTAQGGSISFLCSILCYSVLASQDPRREAVNFKLLVLGVRSPTLQAPRSFSLPSNYQERARVKIARSDGHGRPPKPEIDGREVRPHICTPREGASVRTCMCLGAARDKVVEPL